ncbi:helix-turn-helix domain-containing protein [Porticoccus sp.]
MTHGQLFGKRLKAAFKHAGVGGSLRDKSKVVGLSPSMIGSMESGEKLPSTKTAVKLANQLGVCVEWLINGKGPMAQWTTQEEEIMALFAKLDRRGVERAKDFVEGLLAAKHNGEG